MPAYRSLLEEALEAWEYTRGGVIAEVESFGDAEWDYRPGPASRSVAELVLHILESGLLMSGELTREDGDFTRAPYPDLVAEHSREIQGKRGRAELLGLLRSTGAAGDRRFREVGELHMLQYIRRFDGQPGTRLAWMEHGIAHEEYHRGQLALYVRLSGKVPALTRMILGE